MSISLAGFIAADGYSLIDDDEFSSYGSLQTSSQFTSGANHDSVSPRDETQDMQDQSFVSFQGEPILHEYMEGSVASPHEYMVVQSEIDSEQSGVTPTAIVQKNEQVNSGHQHPFGLLLKEHTQKNSGEPVEDISFPTIQDFRIFIESMKSSFLIPGRDPSKYFQTAQQTLENEIASGAQNTKGESSNSVERGRAHDDGSENEVWSETMNSAFEHSKKGANNKTPSESLPVPDPVISIAGLISPRAYESQESGLSSHLYSSPQLAVKEQISSNYGQFSNAVIPEILTSSPEEHVESTSYMLPEQTPFSSNSLYGEDFTFRGRVTGSPLNPPHPRYKSRKTSSITPLISEQTSQQLQHTSHSEVPPTGFQNPSDFELHSQRKSLGKVTPEKFPSSYDKGFFVHAPRVQYSDLQPTHGERPVPSLQQHQLRAGKESHDINFFPSVPLISDTPSPQRSNGLVGVQASSPPEPYNQVFSKQPVKSHLKFTVKPSSSPRSSSSVHHPSVFNSQTKDEKSDLSKQGLVFAVQEPKHVIENIPSPFPGGFNVSFLAPTSKSKKAFSRLAEVMSRFSGTQKMI